MPGPPGTAIAVFAKAPLAGHVKTRLADALSPSESARFHRVCTHVTWERLQEFRALDAFLFCDRPWAEFEALCGPGRFRLQRGTDLGERMRHCLDDLLAEGYRRALIVGSDAPTLPLAQVREAVSALEWADAAVGPSDDGGFTLIGASRTAPEMFRGVRWSVPDTRRACLRALKSAGLRATPLQVTAYDVDTSADLVRLRRDPALPVRLRRWFDAADRGAS